MPPAALKKFKKRATTNWRTNGGKFTTNLEVQLPFHMPEFCPTKEITHFFAVDETDNDSTYDAIIGRDLICNLQIDILFSKGRLVWDNISIPMKTAPAVQELIKKNLSGHADYDMYLKEVYRMHVAQDDVIQEATSRATEILDADYSKSNIDDIVNKYMHLTPIQRSKLKALLYKHESLFDGTLGTWKTKPVKLELKPGSTPHYQHPYQIPRMHEETLRREVDRLILLGVLEKCNDSEWGSPAFIIPKNDKTVRFVTDFRRLNSQIKRKPYPLPKI